MDDGQRRAIHDLALGARALLTREARDLLEGAYGLYPDGRMDPPEKLPQVRADPETAETYRRLKQFLADEVRAGLAREEAVEKLVKEVAYTHLNRLVAFKMMEARKLIRGTLDRGTESNAFKFYLADAAHAADLALYEGGERDAAYRRFLLWQAGRVAREIRVLFDPDNLPSRLFPRPPALHKLLALLNDPALSPAWEADETIGWIYQYFNEPELQAAFAKVGGGEKFEAEDIPSATQLFTPHWIVRYLVQNTLGRLWVQMHPDTRLTGTEQLDYLVPLTADTLDEPLRQVRDITLLDPACGGMHFGLIAFDLFYAMYAEEFERAGEPGWPEEPSVTDTADIPAAVISRNLFGIDIDLRAVQLSALALYLKAKSYNKDAVLTDNNLAVAGVLPLNGARLGLFLRDAHFTRPVYERLLRALWARLQDARQLGSLLRLEQDLAELVRAEQERFARSPLFAGISGEFEATAGDDAFWEAVGPQIIRSLHEFAREQAGQGHDQTFFVGEAVKGIRLLELMQREYDVVVTNPPYMNRRKMNSELAGLIEKSYPEGKNDLYAAFIQRCLELAGDRGYVGMLTMHSFMFISSYEGLRQELRKQAAIPTMAHCGPALFDVGNPGTLQTTAFILRREPATAARDAATGTYFRLVHAPDGEGKRLAFEQALRDGSNTYRVAQGRFDAIPGAPWVYRISDDIRQLFRELPLLGEVAQPRQGLTTADNPRFIRFYWEVGSQRIGFGLRGRLETVNSRLKWFPLVKGGLSQRWFGGEINVVNWRNDGAEIKHHIIRTYPYLNGKWEWVAKNPDTYFTEGVAYSAISSGSLYFRWMPNGFICEHASNAIFPKFFREDIRWLVALFNSELGHYFLGLNETINVNIEDIVRVPIADIKEDQPELSNLLSACIYIRQLEDLSIEFYWSFVCPTTMLEEPYVNLVHQETLKRIEREINNEIYRLYNISAEDRDAVKAEIQSTIGTLPETGEDDSYLTNDYSTDDYTIATPQSELVNQPYLTIRWLSYAIGIVLGRFQPGVPGALGRAVYHRDDFAIGSLPAPDEAEFDELVGPPERFAYIDEDGGRHVFPAAVEQALRDLAVPDGITVLDAGHPRDLPARVDKALRLMLGDADAQAVIDEAAGGDLRQFLARDYFTQWHFKWYRKRPVYWPLQSARRSYGFVLFHEKIDDQTFFRLQRDYLDAKLNGLSQQIEDLRGRAAGQSGAALKRLAREIDGTAKELEEITDFARTIERIVNDGYRPRPDWIDDGVILRMAPLWELIPIWKTEPKKYWERLQAGDYDWSHIAMAYWPARVREACKTNKSFAIAHNLSDE